MTPEQKAARLAELKAQLKRYADDAAVTQLSVAQLTACTAVVAEILALTVLPEDAPTGA